MEFLVTNVRYTVVIHFLIIAQRSKGVHYFHRVVGLVVISMSVGLATWANLLVMEFCVMLMELYHMLMVGNTVTHLMKALTRWVNCQTDNSQDHSRVLKVINHLSLDWQLPRLVSQSSVTPWSRLLNATVPAGLMGWWLSPAWVQIQVWKEVFQLDWTSGHAMRLNSRTDIEGPPVSSLNCVLTLEGWKAELALGGWLFKYRNKCLAPGIEPGHPSPIAVLTGPNIDSLIEAITLTTIPDHHNGAILLSLLTVCRKFWLCHETSTADLVQQQVRVSVSWRDADFIKLPATLWQQC